MNRQDAERLITERVKTIYGFALKRCRSVQDAEDISQDIIMRAFRALLKKDDVIDVDKFIRAVAHNTLSNYYRDNAKSFIGTSIDDIAEFVADTSDPHADEERQALERLGREIAYLSKTQRRIVIAYYFENRKQADIAAELGIPTGTVKWHLFEAKKELKRGMDTMRKASDLKFNPIKFHSYGINGCMGTKPLDVFFRSSLAQNICYCVREQARTVSQIADALGVSPVYVENEAEFLEEYGFLSESNGKYLTNFIISEPTAELLTLQNDMYRRAAELFVGELYDELTKSGILDDSGIICPQCDGPLSMTEASRGDRNFILLTLIPFIAAWSGESLMEDRISFEEVATLRADGGHNICHASVLDSGINLPDDYIHMKNWSGPMYNKLGGHCLWQINSEWSSRLLGDDAVNYHRDALRILSLYIGEREEGLLSEDEYVWLAERGYIKVCGDYDGHFKTAWQIVMLANAEIKDRLLVIGGRIKAKYKAEFDAIKAPYVEAVMSSVPAHLRKVREYELQFVFYSDGWFLCHCLHALMRDGRLTPPTKDQMRSVMTLIFPK